MFIFKKNFFIKKKKKKFGGGFASLDVRRCDGINKYILFRQRGHIDRDMSYKNIKLHELK